MDPLQYRFALPTDEVVNLRRRALAAWVGVLAVPGWAGAQPTERTYRIGLLDSINSFKEPYSLAFVQRLSELGFVEGRNLVIERRNADGRTERLPELAKDLARQNCDLFFAPGAEANLVAMKEASRDTPIVIVALDYDPVATGHVTDLAHPGGRITGITPLQSVLPAKRLELLKELLPGARKVAVFSTGGTTGQLEVVQDAARRIGLALHVVEFKSLPFDYAAGFADAVRAKADALLALASALFVPGRRKIPELALKARLPSMFTQSQWADAGGLLSYGFNFSDMYRRAAEQTAAILRGARAADIPMEQGLKFELVINMKTAKALELTIPLSILLRADRMIE